MIHNFVTTSCGMWKLCWWFMQWTSVLFVCDLCYQSHALMYSVYLDSMLKRMWISNKLFEKCCWSSQFVNGTSFRTNTNEKSTWFLRRKLTIYLKLWWISSIHWSLCTLLWNEKWYERWNEICHIKFLF